MKLTNIALIALTVLVLLLGIAQMSLEQTVRVQNQLIMQDEQDIVRLKMEIWNQTKLNTAPELNKKADIDLMTMPWYYVNVARSLRQI